MLLTLRLHWKRFICFFSITFPPQVNVALRPVIPRYKVWNSFLWSVKAKMNNQKQFKNFVNCQHNRVIYYWALQWRFVIRQSAVLPVNPELFQDLENCAITSRTQICIHKKGSIKNRSLNRLLIDWLALANFLEVYGSKAWAVTSPLPLFSKLIFVYWTCDIIHLLFCLLHWQGPSSLTDFPLLICMCPGL